MSPSLFSSLFAKGSAVRMTGSRSAGDGCCMPFPATLRVYGVCVGQEFTNPKTTEVVSCY